LPSFGLENAQWLVSVLAPATWHSISVSKALRRIVFGENLLVLNIMWLSKLNSVRLDSHFALQRASPKCSKAGFKALGLNTFLYVFSLLAKPYFVLGTEDNPVHLLMASHKASQE